MGHGADLWYFPVEITRLSPPEPWQRNRTRRCIRIHTSWHHFYTAVSGTSRLFHYGLQNSRMPATAQRRKTAD